jgi:hypothetical protein
MIADSYPETPQGPGTRDWLDGRQLGAQPAVNSGQLHEDIFDWPRKVRSAPTGLNVLFGLPSQDCAALVLGYYRRLSAGSRVALRFVLGYYLPLPTSL